MKRKKIIYVVLALVIFLAGIPTNIAYASSPSQWAVSEIEQAVENKLTTVKVLNNYQQNITREEFAELAVKLYEALTGSKATPVSPNPFKDTNNPEILKANKLGIVGGVTPTEFAPNQPITRQEISVMLLRTIKATYPQSNYNHSNSNRFADEILIAPWALDPVKYLNQQGILGGVGDNRINPRGNTTREQAIVLVNRTYEKYLKNNSDAFNIAISHMPNTLDPHSADCNAAHSIIAQMYDTLIIMENDELLPGLAESWRQVDSLTYEFKIRKNVKFHNGQSLTAKDVAYSLKRSANSSLQGNVLTQLNTDKIQVVDDYTIRISTKEPFAQILNRLTHINTVIISENSVQPVGTGPYQMVSKTSTKIELKAFNQYFRGNAKTSNINYLIIRDSIEVMEAIIEGTVDITYGLDLEQMYALRYGNFLGYNHYRLVQPPGKGTTFVGINSADSPLNDPRVRQALNYAVDVKYIGEILISDEFEVPALPFNPFFWGTHWGIPPYTYNVAYARNLLRDAGYGSGFKASISIFDTEVNYFIAEMIREDLAVLNIELEIIFYDDFGKYLDALAKGDTDLYLLTWQNYAADIDYTLYSLYHTSGDYNYSNYNNPQVDMLLDLARQTADDEVRMGYYLEVQELVDEDAPFILLYYSVDNIAINTRVADLIYNPSNYFILWEAYIR
ncbi:ABC transporter substrate-binding protein [Alkaliphilus transvaalensis]|uniref:ABC transporter substrate-binding protein n=1 Tax=Alkaliphilus transvaalensis TaxID=114628 RepID=UPI00047EBB82|nr:ABC transporter substrate-binding protein [Alkaliphilus transvaalensis]